MTILNLPFWNRAEKELYQIYKANKDIIGLFMLANTFTSKLLTEIIKDIQELESDKTLSYPEKIAYLKVIKEKYERFYNRI